jgi:hypothetical protein
MRLPSGDQIGQIYYAPFDCSAVSEYWVVDPEIDVIRVFAAVRKASGGRRNCAQKPAIRSRRICCPGYPCRSPESFDCNHTPSRSGRQITNDTGQSRVGSFSLDPAHNSNGMPGVGQQRREHATESPAGAGDEDAHGA